MNNEDNTLKTDFKSDDDSDYDILSTYSVYSYDSITDEYYSATESRSHYDPYVNDELIDNLHQNLHYLKNTDTNNFLLSTFLQFDDVDILILYNFYMFDKQCKKQKKGYNDTHSKVKNNLVNNNRKKLPLLLSIASNFNNDDVINSCSKYLEKFDN